MSTWIEKTGDTKKLRKLTLYVLRIQDIDCILYLLSALHEYSRLPLQVEDDGGNVTRRANAEHDNTEYLYHHPLTKSLLAINLAKFNSIGSVCENQLQAALEETQVEAETANEYYKAKKQIYEAQAITSMLLESPESYSTAAIQERNEKRLGSKYGERAASNEISCGRLFLSIKSATISPLAYQPNAANCITLKDIDRAEELLSDLTKRYRLQCLLDGQPGMELPSYAYRRIDPLWHRAFILAEHDIQIRDSLLSRGFQDKVWERNLFDETSAHLAVRFHLSQVLGMLLPLVATYQTEQAPNNLKTPYEVSMEPMDIRGMDISMTAILHNSLDKLIPILHDRASTDRRCFVAATKIFKNKTGRINSQITPSLNMLQLAASVGSIDSLKLLQTHCPRLYSKQGQMVYYNVELAYNNVRNNLTPTSNIGLDDFPPIALAALGRHIHIVEYLDSSYPTAPTTNSDLSSWTLIVIAFKTDQVDLLLILSQRIHNLQAIDVVYFTVMAIEIGISASLFKAWVQVAWEARPDKAMLWSFPLYDCLSVAPIGGQLSWYSEAWHRIVELVYPRQSTSHDIAEKRQWFELLQRMGDGAWKTQKCSCHHCQVFDVSIGLNYSDFLFYFLSFS
ncbi:hypothetical protein ABW20_dc0102802 [Dactylellina cionopaga]|nr:hypothetical protein ABW20_dc0102802 [Dactylellina cionopaga]